jgi:uncharacterized protein (DUF1501 family)
MKMIAKIIASRNTIGIKRQIFFCQLGGWDTHTDQLAGHNKILRAVSRNIKALQDCMEAFGLADNVTLFTASDFGRTYKTNGAGSDHGWGTHTMVVGGAGNNSPTASLKGGKIYGTFPTVVPGGPDDYGSNGRWIPTTAVDEYAATLARWFGVTEANLDVILPNLYRFNHRNLGFLG